MEKQNRAEILLEKIGSDIKAVAEGHSVIRKEIQQSREDLGNRIDTVETVVRSHSKQLKEINQTVNEINQDLKGHIRQSVPPAHVAV